jgi:hypothetical protein
LPGYPFWHSSKNKTSLGDLFDYQLNWNDSGIPQKMLGGDMNISKNKITTMGAIMTNFNPQMTKKIDNKYF